MVITNAVSFGNFMFWWKLLYQAENVAAMNMSNFCGPQQILMKINFIGIHEWGR